MTLVDLPGSPTVSLPLQLMAVSAAAAGGASRRRRRRRTSLLAAAGTRGLRRVLADVARGVTDVVMVVRNAFDGSSDQGAVA